MVHIVLCTTSLETKKTLKPLFACSDLAFVDKQHKPDLIQKKKQNTNCAHWCFWCLKLVLFQKFTGDV